MQKQLIAGYVATGTRTAGLVLADYLDEQGEELAASRLRFVFENDWELDWVDWRESNKTFYWFEAIQVIVQSLPIGMRTIGFLLLVWGAKNHLADPYPKVKSWPKGWKSSRHKEVLDHTTRQILLEVCGVSADFDQSHIKLATQVAWEAVDNADRRGPRRAVQQIAWWSRSIEECVNRPAWSVRRLVDSFRVASAHQAAFSLFRTLKNKQTDWDSKPM
ncbi:MAG: hypothetical protein ACFCD0_17970 [Gemmataceae bacterium]